MPLRPKRMERDPANSIETMADIDGELTSHPTWVSVSPSSGCKNRVVPDMTEASNPKRNPPRETISAILRTSLETFGITRAFEESRTFWRLRLKVRPTTPSAQDQAAAASCRR